MHVWHEGTCPEPGLPQAHLLRPCARRVPMTTNTCILNELHQLPFQGDKRTHAEKHYTITFRLFTLQPHNMQNSHALAAFVYDY